jgi:hypothetical protein
MAGPTAAVRVYLSLVLCFAVAAVFRRYGDDVARVIGTALLLFVGVVECMALKTFDWSRLCRLSNQVVVAVLGVLFIASMAGPGFEISTVWAVLAGALAEEMLFRESFRQRLSASQSRTSSFASLPLEIWFFACSTTAFVFAHFTSAYFGFASLPSSSGVARMAAGSFLFWILNAVYGVGTSSFVHAIFNLYR